MFDKFGLKKGMSIREQQQRAYDYLKEQAAQGKISKEIYKELCQYDEEVLENRDVSTFANMLMHINPQMKGKVTVDETWDFVKPCDY